MFYYAGILIKNLVKRTTKQNSDAQKSFRKNKKITGEMDKIAVL